MISAAARTLSDAGVHTPVLDAQLLMVWAIGRDRLWVVAHPEHVPCEASVGRFQAAVKSRAERYPLAYIVGCREFYGLDILVSPAVLIPRPETELLVEECVRRLQGRPSVIADVGTGSGAVAVAVAKELPQARVYATDVSPEALEVAGANIEKHQLSARVITLLGDMLDPIGCLRTKLDAVVSNPPYIPSSEIESLQPEVRLYEPRTALDGGEDGLDAFRTLLPAAFEVLQEGGFCAVEVGAGQAAEVRQIGRSAGYAKAETRNDLAGVERVVVLER